MSRSCHLKHFFKFFTALQWFWIVMWIPRLPYGTALHASWSNWLFLYDWAMLWEGGGSARPIQGGVGTHLLLQFKFLTPKEVDKIVLKNDLFFERSHKCQLHKIQNYKCLNFSFFFFFIILLTTYNSFNLLSWGLYPKI